MLHNPFSILICRSYQALRFSSCTRDHWHHVKREHPAISIIDWNEICMVIEFELNISSSLVKMRKQSVKYEILYANYKKSSNE